MAQPYVLVSNKVYYKHMILFLIINSFQETKIKGLFSLPFFYVANENNQQINYLLKMKTDLNFLHKVNIK